MVKKDMIVSAIENGIVIDRIPASKALKIVKLLGLEDDTSCSVAIAVRVKSSKIGLKDVVKVQGRDLDDEELAKIGLIAPGVTVSRVRDYEVVEKYDVKVPDEVSGILKCINPTCATNFREPVVPEFDIIRAEPLLVRCKFCDRVMLEENVLGQFI